VTEPLGRSTPTVKEDATTLASSRDLNDPIAKFRLIKKSIKVPTQ
jgi:hypothetical protein